MRSQIVSSAAVLLLSFVVRDAWGVQYSVTDLGALSGGDSSSNAFEINNNGQIVGLSSVADGSHAFLYSNGVMTDLGLLGDGQHSTTAYDINDSGHIVGHSFGDGSGNHPFLYSNGSMINLGTLGGVGGNGYGINNSDHVVGISSDANGATHAFLWSNGAMIDLHPTGAYSSGSDINDVGQIAGVNAPNGFSRGFLLENGVMTDLGDLVGGSGQTTAFRMNNVGQVVGWSGILDGTTSHPFIWENGVMEDLGSLTGRTDWGYARGINNLGDVVGSSGGHAFVWDSVGGMRDINGLLDGSGADWELLRAYDINDGGRIVGAGTNAAGQTHAFLLTPVPEPSTLALVGVGALGLLACAWRRRRG